MGIGRTPIMHIMSDHREGADLLSHDLGPTTPPLLDLTIGACLRQTTARFGGREALVDCASGQCWTYDELLADAQACALGLLGLGVRPGERVGIWSPNRPEWVLGQLGSALIGAVMVTINPAYRTHELAYVLRQAGISVLLAAPAFKTSDYRAMVEQVRPECPDLREVVFFEDPGWASLMATGREASPDALVDIEAALAPADPINIQYTSGTTGFPKGATLTHRNILNNGYLVGEMLGYDESDRICIPVPFYHCFGMVMGNLAAVSHGSTMLIPAPGFDPGLTLAAVEAERCTSLYGVPTMFIAMLGHDDVDTRDLSSLRTGIMAGSPCPVEVMKQVVERMGMSEVSICYGMTETSPVSTQTARDDSIDRRVSTVGRVHPHVEIKVVDPSTGQTLPRGMPGEFCTRGYSVMLGYWDEPAKTAEAIDADGWMHTGDIAVMDDEGYVNITGRIKDMVIRGGENIYPREIEEFLYTHPDIVDAQVIGVPDAKYGEELVAWVRLRPDSPALTIDGLRAFCDGRLAHYKVPRYLRIVDEFPMTVTGKIRKVEMREVSITELGLADAAGIETA